MTDTGYTNPRENLHEQVQTQMPEFEAVMGLFNPVTGFTSYPSDPWFATELEVVRALYADDKKKPQVPPAGRGVADQIHSDDGRYRQRPPSEHGGGWGKHSDKPIPDRQKKTPRPS
jgi:hypothetical protein